MDSPVVDIVFILRPDEIAELRALSTRATITPASFTNEYNWGDFKGNPGKLMQRYFDAHVYVANWKTAIFMVRLPSEALTQKTAKTLTVPYMMDITPTRTHWIITSSLEESEDYARFNMEDGRGWMARLSPIRDELLQGDLRSLYIGWLAALTTEMMDEDDMEPLSFNGLGNLTAAQQALAEFLEVDPDLLAGAGMGNPAVQEAWASVKEPVERGSGRGYDEACRMLVCIAEAYDLYATRKQFKKELEKFMAGYLRRKALIQRLVRAGIWKGQ